ncbi:MAG: Calx-beta domain-containing protein [Pyrinomonadaceae bacterium]
MSRHVRSRLRTKHLLPLFLSLACVLALTVGAEDGDLDPSLGSDRVTTAFHHATPKALRLRLERSREGFASWLPGTTLQQSSEPIPVVSEAVRFAVSPPLDEIAEKSEPSKSMRRGKAEANTERPEKNVSPPLSGQSDKDGALARPAESSVDPNIPGTISNFEGLSNIDNLNNPAIGFLVSPPDTVGDVGATQYVQATNLLFRVFTKSGAPQLATTRPISTLFTALGGRCAANDDGDPIVLYDSFADRWIITQFVVSGPAPLAQCFAISQTGDATGSYFTYEFVMPNNKFNDYPKFGVWPNGYYWSNNQFNLAGSAFLGVGVFALDRAKVLAGDPTASYIYFDLETAIPNARSMLPSDADGLAPPPPSAPNVFAYFNANEFTGDAGDSLRLFNFHADFAVPANSRFAERADSPLPVAAFNPLNPSGQDDIEQPPPSTATSALDSISDRLMHRLQYRNFGSYEALTVNHTVNVGTGATLATHQAGVRYYELRRTVPAGAWTAREQATFAPDTDNRWMGSSAMDNQGNLAMGYSVSSTATFPSIRYAGRLVNDPLGGLFQGEASVIAGTGAQTNTGSRWGDYSAMTVDPTDDCTFFYTQEYYQTTDTTPGDSPFGVNWQTRVGSFKFTQCNAPAQGTLQVNVTNCATGQPIQGARVSINSNLYDATGANGQSLTQLAPGIHSVQVSRPSFSPAAANATITNGNTTTISVCLTGTPSILPTGSTITAESCSPTNNALDPGETVTVNFGLKNNGTASTVNLMATLQSTGGVTNTQSPNPQSYGAIPPDNTTVVTRPFTFTVAPSAACGSTVTATLQLQDGANNLGTVSFTLQVGALGGAVTATYSSGNIAVPIPDVATVEIPINVPHTGQVQDVNVRVRLNHTFDGDLDISLVHPDGTVVLLSNNRGGSGDNFGTGANDCSGTPTVFDDEAASTIAGGTAPFAGSFRPEQALTGLDGKSLNGTWMLRVADTAAIDVGTIGCVTLEIARREFVCCSVPTSSSDLSVAIADSPDPVATNANLTYAITITNHGPDLATGVTLADALPAGTTFVTASSGCSLSGNTVTCSIGNLASGMTATRNIVVTPTRRELITNTASVTANNLDPNIRNNATTQVTTVSGAIGAIRNLQGFNANSVGRNDDSSTGAVPLGFTINFFGTSYSSVFVNNNGNVTFDAALATFTPFPLSTTQRVIIAAFFADVDTRASGSSVVTYGNDVVNGRPAFGVNGINVGYFSSHTDKLNSFQLILIDRADTGQGNFDVEFNYNKIQWETGDASGGIGGLGGSSARVGYSNGTANPGTFAELSGSAINGAFLDSNTMTGLIHNSVNSTANGRYVFGVRAGLPPASDLSITKSDSPDPVTVGNNLTYGLTASNNGPADATGVTITDTLPTGVTFVSASATQGPCSHSSGTVTCTIGNLANNATSTVTIVVTPIAAGNIMNTASVTGNEADPNSANNTTTQGTTVAAAPSSLQFGAATYSAGEASGTTTISVTRTGGSSGAASVQFLTAGGGTATGGASCTAGVDYLTTSGTLNWAAGDVTNKTFPITICNDTVFEGSESVNLALSNASGATLGSPNTATLTITDNDLRSTISITDVAQAEGNSGTTSFGFTVSLSNPSPETVTVNYATANGTATAGSDYQAISATTLTFNPGVTSQPVNVQVIGDTLDEENETFLVNLSGATNATIADNQGLGTINDDDALPNLTISDVSQVEGNSGPTSFDFTVRLSVVSGRTVTVNYATADGTGTAGSDYQGIGLTALTFTPGQTTKTVTVLVNGDTTNEADETFFVNVSGAANANITDSQGQGTITNDDALPTLSINDVSVTEGNSGTVNAVFTVNLSPASGQTVTVNYATANGTATAGGDYLAINTTTLTLNPGETNKPVTVLVIGDTLNEADETFPVNLTNPTNATVTDNQGLGTITNDDPVPTGNLEIRGRTVDDSARSISGVIIFLSGAASGTTTTDSNGNYSFANLSAGDYTVAPSISNYSFSPANQTFNNLSVDRIANFVGTQTAVSITGRVTDSNDIGLGAVSLSLTRNGIPGETASTDGLGNYGFGNLSAGTNYVVMSAGSFTPSLLTFNNLSVNATANFKALPISPPTSGVITGRVTDANGNPLTKVTLTLSGPITGVASTDSAGNYAFINLTPGGNYTVTIQNSQYVFAPSRADFFNLDTSQTFNPTAAPVAVPEPTPSANDDFSSATRDSDKWSLGTQTQPPQSFDPQVNVSQASGQLVITPLTQAAGLHYNGYVSANAFDITNGSVSVQVVSAASGGADTVFAIGSDLNNFYRFMVRTAGGSAGSVMMIRGTDGVERPLDTTVSQLLFQIVIAGQPTTLPVPYDSNQHKFLRFRHVSPVVSPQFGKIVFEVSPDGINYTPLHESLLNRGVTPLTTELSAGTSSPTNPGLAVFDDVKYVNSTFQFSAAGYSVGEGDGSIQITVTRSGNMGETATVDYATADGTATQSTRYINAAGRLTYAAGEASKTFGVLIVDNAHAEGNQNLNLNLSLPDPATAGLNAPGRATLTIADNDTTLATSNPLDTAQYFAQQHYSDFFNREPDASGLAFWTNQITSCGSDSECIAIRRINVSAAFFLSPEFQETGFLAYRFYNLALNRPNGLPGYTELFRDAQAIGRGFVGGAPGSEALLEANKVAYANEFATRAEFTALYPLNLTPVQFVDALYAHAGITPSAAERQAAIDEFNNPTGARGRVLRRVAENQTLSAREFNRAFVLAQYFGYLRRNPDDAPDNNLDGYNFWLGKLNEFNGNFVNAEMVKAFITSGEYRQRFGP